MLVMNMFYQERLSEMTASRLGELPGSTESAGDQSDLPPQRQVYTPQCSICSDWLVSSSVLVPHVPALVHQIMDD